MTALRSRLAVPAAVAALAAAAWAGIEAATRAEPAVPLAISAAAGGPAVPDPLGDFSYTVTCGDSPPGVVATPSVPAGESVTVEVPASTPCTVRETGTGGATSVGVAVDGVEGATVSADGTAARFVTPAADGPATTSTSTSTSTTGPGGGVEVSFTNTFLPGVALEVRAAALGSTVGLAPFEFSLVCGEDRLPVPPVPAGGSTRVLGLSPATACELTEVDTRGATTVGGELVGAGPGTFAGPAARFTTPAGGTVSAAFVNTFATAGDSVSVSIAALAAGDRPDGAPFGFTLACDVRGTELEDAGVPDQAGLRRFPVPPVAAGTATTVVGVPGSSVCAVAEVDTAGATRVEALVSAAAPGNPLTPTADSWQASPDGTVVVFVTPPSGRVSVTYANTFEPGATVTVVAGVAGVQALPAGGGLMPPWAGATFGYRLACTDDGGVETLYPLSRVAPGGSAAVTGVRFEEPPPTTDTTFPGSPEGLCRLEAVDTLGAARVAFELEGAEVALTEAASVTFVPPAPGAGVTAFVANRYPPDEPSATVRLAVTASTPSGPAGPAPADVVLTCGGLRHPVGGTGAGPVDVPGVAAGAACELFVRSAPGFLDVEAARVSNPGGGTLTCEASLSSPCRRGERTVSFVVPAGTPVVGVEVVLEYLNGFPAPDPGLALTASRQAVGLAPLAPLHVLVACMALDQGLSFHEGRLLGGERFTGVVPASANCRVRVLDDDLEVVGGDITVTVTGGTGGPVTEDDGDVSFATPPGGGGGIAVAVTDAWGPPPWRFVVAKEVEGLVPLTVAPGNSLTTGVRVPHLTPRGDVLVAVDATPSMSGSFERALADAAALADHLLARGDTAVAVARVGPAGAGPVVSVVAPVTADRAAVRAAIESLEPAPAAEEGPGAPYNALLAAAGDPDDRAGIGWRPATTSRAVVVVGDTEPYGAGLDPGLAPCGVEAPEPDPGVPETAAALAGLAARATDLYFLAEEEPPIVTFSSSLDAVPGDGFSPPPDGGGTRDGVPAAAPSSDPLLGCWERLAGLAGRGAARLGGDGGAVTLADTVLADVRSAVGLVGIDLVELEPGPVPAGVDSTWQVVLEPSGPGPYEPSELPATFAAQATIVVSVDPGTPAGTYAFGFSVVARATSRTGEPLREVVGTGEVVFSVVAGPYPFSLTCDQGGEVLDVAVPALAGNQSAVVTVPREAGCELREDAPDPASVAMGRFGVVDGAFSVTGASAGPSHRFGTEDGVAGILVTNRGRPPPDTTTTTTRPPGGEPPGGRTAPLVVRKVVGGGGPGAFSFTQDCGGQAQSFVLRDGESRTTPVPVGAACTVTEGTRAGVLTLVEVEGSTTPPVVGPGPGRASGTVSPGGLTMVFTSPAGELVVELRTVRGPAELGPPPPLAGRPQGQAPALSPARSGAAGPGGAAAGVPTVVAGRQVGRPGPGGPGGPGAAEPASSSGGASAALGGAGAAALGVLALAVLARRPRRRM